MDINSIEIDLVDDDASVRRGVSRLLRSHGFSCRTYECGEAALADPMIGSADCLILDVQLPGIDGFETRDKLRQQGLNIPILFITGHPDIESSEWLRRLGGQPFLGKPFQDVELVAMIRRLLYGWTR